MKIPAIQGRIGTTTYYTTNLSFLQINQLVKKVDDELHTSSSLKEQIQRSLTDNHVKIKDYILNKEDHFFGSLVLAIYDGKPTWTEVRYEIESEPFYNVGLLELNGNEKIFPVDGQHRVEGIKAAIEVNPELQSETIPVMIIAHSKTPEGMERSRRIFSTLNRYAKPVRLGDIIALDEDDAVAIITRELLETYELFIGNRVKVANSKSLPSTNKMAFTSLITLYECNFALYKAFKFKSLVSDTKVKSVLKIRPDDIELLSLEEYYTCFWNKFIESFEEIQEYLSDTSDNAAESYRSIEDGGNVFFRPVSLLPFIQACVIIHLKTDETYDSIMSKFSTINRKISAPIWGNILWNANAKKMVENNRLTVKLLLVYIYNKALLSQQEIKKLYSKYAEIHNLTEIEAQETIDNFIL